MCAPSWRVRDCIVQAAAPAPVRPIERGLPGSSLLAHMLIGKFADHLPLYRQSGIYARDGVELPRSLLADWVGACSDLVDPLVAALRCHVTAGVKLHADDTTLPVPPGLGKAKTGRLWTYGRDDRPDRLSRRRCGSPTRRTARASIRSNT